MADMSSDNFFVCPHLDVFVDPFDLRSTFTPVLSIAKPLWKAEGLRYDESPLARSKGLINTMVKCFNSENHKDAIMVRIFNSGLAALNEQRSNEVNGIKHLYTKGCAPKLLATFQNGFCYEYIPGEVLAPARLREEPIWTRIAEEFAKYHTGTYEDEKLNRKHLFSDMAMKEFERFPTKLKNPEQNERFQKEYPSADWLKKEMIMLTDHVAQIGSPIVLCHNDTRAENFIWNSKTETVHFVDFEVITYNYQAQEIATHFLRYAGLHNPDFSLYPDEDLQRKWLRVYLRKYFLLTGKNPDDVTDLHVQRLQIQVDKCLLVVLLTCAVWINLADLVDEKELDWLSLSLECLKRYKKYKDRILSTAVPEL